MATVMNAQAVTTAVGAVGAVVDGKRVKNDGKFVTRRNAFIGREVKCRAGFGEGVGRLQAKSQGQTRRGVRVLGVVTEKVVGNGSGATNSAVAVMEGSGPAVVSGAEGQKATPFGVAYTENGEQLMGQSYERQAVENPTFDDTAVESPQNSLQWRCVESTVENDRLHYGRFAMSPFRSGQANTVGTAMRRALLGEVEGAAITCAKMKNVTHEYCAVDGIQESVLDILLNLKEVVIRSDTREPQKAYISVMGPGKVTTGDINLPPSLEVTDPSQHIALLTKAVPFEVELEVEKDCGYRIVDPSKSTDGRFYIDSVFMPVRNANYSVHCFENGDKTQEILFIEIWTNGSITPEEALYEAARSLIDLLLPFLHDEKKEVANRSENEHGSTSISYLTSFLPSSEQVTKDVTYKHVFIDQLKLPARAYNCLKRANIHTVADLLNYTQDDLMKIKNFGKKSVEEVLEALKSQFSINLSKSRL